MLMELAHEFLVSIINSLRNKFKVEILVKFQLFISSYWHIFYVSDHFYYCIHQVITLFIVIHIKSHNHFRHKISMGCVQSVLALHEDIAYYSNTDNIPNAFAILLWSK